MYHLPHILNTDLSNRNDDIINILSTSHRICTSVALGRRCVYNVIKLNRPQCFKGKTYKNICHCFGSDAIY